MTGLPAIPHGAGRHALVVGASSGIGRGVAARLADLGMRVAIVGRRAALLAETAEAMRAACAIVADVREPADCDRIADEAAAALGPIDLLVYAAGTSPLAELVDLDATQWRAVLETNVVGASLVTRGLVPHLAPGAIAGYLSSETVGRPRHGLVAYAASKIALEELVRGWRVEQPRFRFVCIRVGQTVGTDFARDFDADAFTRVWPHWLAHGAMREQHMEPRDLGACIAESLTLALEHPRVDLERIDFRPPGPVAGAPEGP